MAEFIFAFPTLIFIMNENWGPHTPPANCKCAAAALILLPMMAWSGVEWSGAFRVDKQPGGSSRATFIWAVTTRDNLLVAFGCAFQAWLPEFSTAVFIASFNRKQEKRNLKSPRA